MRRHFSIVTATLLLGGCATPTLQANWHIVHPDPPPFTDESVAKTGDITKDKAPAPQAPSASSADDGLAAPFTYDDLRRKTKMLIVILNRGASDIALRRVAVNMNLSDSLSEKVAQFTMDHIRIGPRQRSDLPQVNSVISMESQPYWLPPGGLHVVDVTGLALQEVFEKAAPSQRGGTLRCQVPLWLSIEYDSNWPTTSRQTLQLKLPNPMPSALPDGWEYCGNRLKVAPQAPSSKASGTASDATSPP